MRVSPGPRGSPEQPAEAQDDAPLELGDHPDARARQHEQHRRPGSRARREWRPSRPPASSRRAGGGAGGDASPAVDPGRALLRSVRQEPSARERCFDNGVASRLRRHGRRPHRAGVRGRRAGRADPPPALRPRGRASAGPVSRDDGGRGASACPRATAAFHLDRLVDDGLLDVHFERRTGRTGPGAGRPAKLYRRADCVGRGLAARAALRPGRRPAGRRRWTRPSGPGSAPRARWPGGPSSGAGSWARRRRPRRRRAGRRAAGARGARLRAARRRTARVVAGQLPVPRAGAGAHRAGLRDEPAAARRACWTGVPAPGSTAAAAAGARRVLRAAGADAERRSRLAPGC